MALSLRRSCWLAKNVACCGEPPAPAPRHSPAQARFNMIFLNADSRFRRPWNGIPTGWARQETSRVPHLILEIWADSAHFLLHAADVEDNRPAQLVKIGGELFSKFGCRLRSVERFEVDLAEVGVEHRGHAQLLVVRARACHGRTSTSLSEWFA